MLEVTSKSYDDLNPEERHRLIALADDEFGGFDIVRNTEWASPNWVFLCSYENELAGCYNLVLRKAEFDGKPVMLAGLNNMITLPAFRGRRVASHLLENTQKLWFNQFKAEYGLLLCADQLVEFYAQFGWRLTSAEIRYKQPGGIRVWSANCMLLTNEGSWFEPELIDLCGLPW